MAAPDKRHSASAAKRSAADHGTAVELEREIGRSQADVVELERKVKVETRELLSALDAKERMLSAMRTELDMYEAKNADPVRRPETVRAIDPNVQIDVYRELLARTESAHTRLEYLRIALENLDRKFDASFAGVFEALGSGEAARRARLSNRIDGFFGRNARALIALGAAAALVLLWNMLARAV